MAIPGHRNEASLRNYIGIPRNLHVPVNSAAFVHKTRALSSLLPNCPKLPAALNVFDTDYQLEYSESCSGTVY